MEARSKVKLKIFDQVINIRCPSPDEMYSLARLVDDRMESFYTQDERISVTQLAILAALSLAQEAHELRQQNAEQERRIGILEHKLASVDNNDIAGQPRH